MIESWTLGNFKSIYDEITLPFGPLTVFAGANSSGKSTVIQSILLTAQTLQSPVYSRSVILNGHILRLGTFRDVVANRRENQAISIGFQLVPRVSDIQPPSGHAARRFSLYRQQESLKAIDCHFTFSAQGVSKEQEVLQLQPRLESMRLHAAAMGNEKQLEETISIVRAHHSVAEREKRYRLSADAGYQRETASLEYEVLSPKSLTYRRRYNSPPTTNELAGAVLQHFLPASFSVVFDAVEEHTQRFADVLMSPDDPGSRDFALAQDQLAELFNSDVIALLRSSFLELEVPELNRWATERLVKAKSVFPEILTLETWRVAFKELPVEARKYLQQKLLAQTEQLRALIRGDAEAEFTISEAPLLNIIEHAKDFTQRYFTRNLKYLGPLRDEPKPVYPLTGATDPSDVGFRGEHTAAVLELNKNVVVSYVAAQCFATQDSRILMTNATLHAAVLDWLRYMGIVTDVRTTEKGSLGHELHVAIGDVSNLHDLTHVGVGVSQVLPILVLSLLAEAGSTLIFEQPELHLHPRVQTRLADFFVSMTMLGKQCLVETHSEYLINRLRFRAVISEGDTLSRQTFIYFVEKESAQSHYRRLRMNEFGVMDAWPKGFFDESEENAAAILRIGMLKRKSGGGSNP